MSAWTNLAAISVNANNNNTYNWATKKQVGAVAGRLGKMIEEGLEKRGVSAGGKYVRDLRLRFLTNVLEGVDGWRGNGEFTSANQLSFGEASAVLDWLEGDSAADDLAAWLAEQGLPCAEKMFEQAK